ncbi:MAG TPA: hypothetical protein VGM90_02870 [Kofleriaceae bacterium]|jgi:hypothetical protein
MSFPWLDRTPQKTNGANRRHQVAADEIASRAALLFRLGFSEADATTRLCERIAWEYDQPVGKGSSHARPASLDDKAIGAIVKTTYARRPG